MRRIPVLILVSLCLSVVAPAPPAVADTPRQTAAQVEYGKRVKQWIDAVNFARWIATANYNAWMAAAVRYEATHRHGACGGDLPPCYVMMRESRGDIHAQNPHSSASGKWQVIDGTWHSIPGTGGYRHARDAPEGVQDDAARWLWAGGRGCHHWNAC